MPADNRLQPAANRRKLALVPFSRRSGSFPLHDVQRLWLATADAFAGEQDRRRLFLWLPVSFGLGITGYFLLPREPMLSALLPVALLWAGWATFRIQRGRGGVLIATVAAAAIGMTVAKLRVDLLAAPVIRAPHIAEVTGRVIGVQPRAGLRPRVVLADITIAGLAADATPGRIRLSMSQRAVLPKPGDVIAGRMRLMPVPGPAAPGDYDPRRAAFFDGIGGSAILFGPWRPVTSAHDDGPGAGLWLARLRAAIAGRITQARPDVAGAIATALLIGERSRIPPQVSENLQRSGLAHILAISGLHMGLVAGTMYQFVRLMLAAFPSIALTQPIRKWAAAAALIVGTVYLVLSGMSVATVRAYVMAAVMFTAILLDRPALSMRNLATAAFVVMIAAPESVLEPGFQMSFAAVVALVAVWEGWRERRKGERFTRDRRNVLQMISRRILTPLLAIAVTTLVASVATAPVAAYHFQRIALYSLLGNLFAMPIVSTIVMPAGLVSLLAMPFGLEAVPLAIMSIGIDAVLAVADRVAGLEGAVRPVSAMPGVAYSAMFIGLLWTCLWHSKVRLAGPIMVGLGIAITLIPHDRPLVRVNTTGTIVAVRGPNGDLRVSGGRAGSYVLQRWYQRDGMLPPARPGRTGVTCDRLGCVLDSDQGLVVAHVRDALAFAEDCARADLVVTILPAPAYCAASVISGGDLAERGSHALYDAGEDAKGRRRIRTETAYEAIRRPWQR